MKFTIIIHDEEDEHLVTMEEMEENQEINLNIGDKNVIISNKVT